MYPDEFVFDNLISETTPLVTVAVAVPPVPSPIIGMPEISPSTPSTVAVPLLLITIVSNLPSTAASFIVLVETSPHFSGRGMYEVVTNLTISAGAIV